MTMPGEGVLTAAEPICSDCGEEPLRRLTLYPPVGPGALQTWCSCGPHTRESIYVDAALAPTMLAQAKRIVENAPTMAAAAADLREYLTKIGAAR